MRPLNKTLLRLVVVFVLITLIYAVISSIRLDRITKENNDERQKTLYISNKYLFSTLNSSANHLKSNSSHNVWCIFTRIKKNVLLKHKFRIFVTSLIKHSSVPICLHILSDNSSKIIAKNILDFVTKSEQKVLFYNFYDIKKAASTVDDIINSMMPFFSSKPGTYYSDALFYLSLGLHRIAPNDQKQAIMLDCDIKAVSDITVLFKQFKHFNSNTLFGLAPELTPVYRHVLYSYRLKNKNTTFGDFIHYIYTSDKQPVENNSMFQYETTMLQKKLGFPGFNSGVVLFEFDNIRQSKIYSDLISKSSVEYLTKKYNFRGHLGDQDFYTLLGYEYPDLIKTLPCGFNRQLCVWWRDHGYSDVFSNYSNCNNKIIIYHGNCNTQIPEKP